MENKVRHIIADILNLNPDELRSDSDITSFVNWDSLAQVRIIAELEYMFECSIPIEKVPLLKTVGDFVNVIL
jgi:acyl carrier protein